MFRVGLCKRLTAACGRREMKGRRGDSILRCLHHRNEESPCQHRRLGLVRRFCNANLALNGRAMRWHEHTLTLFQLHGIKHCRYAGHRIFIKRGGWGYGGLWPPGCLTAKVQSRSFHWGVKTKESRSFAWPCKLATIG